MRTVKVRVAVSVDRTGDWNSFGGCKMLDKDAVEFSREVLQCGERTYWLTAEIEVPEEIEVQADIETAS